MPDGSSSTVPNPGTDPNTQSQLQPSGSLINNTSSPGASTTPVGSSVVPGATPTSTAVTAGQYSGLINQGTPTPTNSAGPAGTPAAPNASAATATNLGAPAVAPVTIDPATMTTQGQVSNIISSGSPLMEQATAAANNAMNERGLTNSTMGVTAAQSALYAAAIPMAEQDAQAYYNADAATAAAMNQSAIAALSSQTTLAGQASQQLIARIQSDTSISTQQMSDYSAQIIAAINSNTTLSAQDAADSTTMAKDMADNATSSQIATLQSTTSLTVQQMQDQTQTAITGLNNTSALAVQSAVNAGNLANIASNGTINEQITQMTDDNKSLLQTSSSAQALYTQSLTNLSNIITNPNLSADQKTAALNDTVAELQDGLNTLSQTIGLTPGLQSDLTFTNPADTTAGPTTTTPAPATSATPSILNSPSTPAAGTSPPLPSSGNDNPNMTALTQAYTQAGSTPDPTGLSWWENQVSSGNVTLQQAQQEIAADIAQKNGPSTSTPLTAPTPT